MKWIIALLFSASVAIAGLPPTTSQDFSDANDVTTFKYRFPNFTGTHIGTVFSLGVNSITGGGTGQITANAAFNALAPSQVGQTGNFLTTNGTNTSWAAQTGLSIGALDGNGASANGASIAASTLFMQSASNTAPGLMNTGAQSIAGAKNFTGSISGELLSTMTYFASPSGSRFYTVMPETASVPIDTNLGFANITGNWTWQEPNQSGTYLVDTMLPSGTIFVGNGSNVAVSATPSGNLSMSNTGVFSIVGPINMGNTKITNLTDPTAAQDAATKNYVDTVASGYLTKANNLSDVAVSATAFANIAPTGANGNVMTLVGGVWTAQAPAAAGSGNLNAKFTLNDAVVPYINIDGPHYQVNTQALSIVNISMLNSGISGTTVVQLNQYRAGVFNQAVTASANASSGNPIGVAASLNQSLSLLAGDVVTVDISKTASGAPESLTVEY